MEIEPIAHIESPYLTKFGVPRQPGLVRGLVSRLVFERGAEIPLSGLKEGQYLWLLWDFSENHREARGFSPTIRPPRLGGNKRIGVFASRSSFRPNNLAISAVQVAGVLSGSSIALIGADLVDGTPVYAVRRYDPERDCFPDAAGGWLEGNAWQPLSKVEIPATLLARIPADLQRGVRELLLQDPRPAYTRKTQPDREFWVPVERIVVSFRVEGETVVVTDVRELSEAQFKQLKVEGTIS